MEEVTIDSYGYDGEGVGRLNGKVVFVPLTLAGERVKIEVFDERSTFVKAKAVQILQESNERVKAPCKYYGRCGSCQYQHTNYQNELEIKKQLLAGQLKKVNYEGQIEVIKSNNEYGYRNKIKMFVGEDSLCLKERGGNVLCEINKCLLVSQRMNNAIAAINTFLKNQNLFVKYSQVLLREEGEFLTVVFYCKMRKTDVDYQGIYLVLGKNCGIFESYNDVLIHKNGIKTLNCQEFGLNCQFSPTSFHQVNGQVGKALYEYVLDNLQGQNVINCYSGAGVLSGAIAKTGKNVIGIELGESEHEDAQKLKEENELFGLINLNGDCAEVLPSKRGETIIVDPPRKGVDEKVISALNGKKFKRLIYISCNSATLVRDIQRLKGFTIKKVALFDMFARTGEYEVVTILDKGE